LLQPLKILEWKWEEIRMDFIVGLPQTQAGYDSIWIIVDRLTKVAHFIPVKTTYSGAKLAELYMSRIVCLHGVPKKVVSDRGSQFTSKFWEKLHESMDTKLNFGLAYHPQTDGQTERTNQILEDMLRACALKYGKVGTRSCRMQNSPTIIVIKLVSRWLHMKHYTDASAEPHYFGVRLEKVKLLDQKYKRMLRSKFRWFMKV
jgi:transposase InsO family protein